MQHLHLRLNDHGFWNLRGSVCRRGEIIERSSLTYIFAICFHHMISSGFFDKTIKKLIHVSGDKLRALCESFFVGRCVIFSPFIRLNDCYSLAKLLEHFVIWQSRGAVWSGPPS